MKAAIWAAAGALAALVLFALGATFNAWRRLKGRHIPRRTLTEHRAFIEPYLAVSYPPGDGPFPAVLLFHGCGGVRRVTHAYARDAVRAGAAAIIVDSLAPRRISYEQALARVCTGRQLWGRERAADVAAALDIVRADPKIDSGRLAIAAWSHGAWSVLDAMALARTGQPPDGILDAPEAPFAGVRAVMAIYPFLSFPALVRRHDWLDTIPVEAVLVENDTMARETDAAEVFERMKQHGAPVTWSTLGGVTHGFDEPDHYPGSQLCYDDEAAAQTRARFTDFLRRRIDARPE